MARIGRKLLAGEELGAVVEEDISAGHGVGKAHSVEMVIMTPEGPARWGDLMPGDVVFGAEGAPVNITATRHYRSAPMYRVTFDDGSFADVSSGHLWSVRGRQERRTGSTAWRTMSTIDILEAGVKRRNGAAMARQWEIPTQGAAQFAERKIDVHPYLMGVWLGDGSKGVPAWGKPHVEVLDRVRALGYEVRTRANGITQYVQNASHLFRGGVFDCGSHERFIPDDYKFNTVENRMELLRGLCDTDGEAHHSGSIGYSTTSRRLADDVVWLARSLGCKAAIQPTVKEAWYRGDGGEKVPCRDCYRVTINAPFNPFSIGYRRDAYKPSEERYAKRWVESIEPIGDAEAMCITVDADDGLYQANDFIVTHNSANVAWLILWAISTHPDTRGVVTANTDTQLRTKTWAELGKWHSLFKAREMFRFNATSICSNEKGKDKTWRIDSVPWSKDNPESFAGMHNKGRRILVIFDEASTIDDLIWETTEGALTDEKTQIIWCRYGNPTRTSGQFHRRCTRPRRNHYARVDSRTVRFTNKSQIQAWIDEYGEDSDFVRVRVKGQFPRAGVSNFISPELTDAARRRDVPRLAYEAYPKILSVDPARFGDDWTIITLRQGLKVHWQQGLMGFDGVDVGGRIGELVRQFQGISCIVYDAVGNGADLDSTLRRMPGLPALVPVQWGVPATDDKQYYNQRAEAWGRMREWLEKGMIPDDDELCDQLTSLDYGFDVRYRIQLQKKSEIKKNGGKSPDKADSLALSFIPDLIRMEVSTAKVRPTQQRKVIWSKTR
jgi:hypothetical protein